MTYPSLLIMNAIQLKKENYSLNYIVKYLKNNFKEFEKKTPRRSIISLWFKLFNENISLLNTKLSNIYNKNKKKTKKI